MCSGTDGGYADHLWSLSVQNKTKAIENVDVPVPSGPDGKPPAEYKLWGDDEKMRSFHREKLHPDVRVPVLSAGPKHGDGFSLFESLAINRYVRNLKQCAAEFTPFLSVRGF